MDTEMGTNTNEDQLSKLEVPAVVHNFKQVVNGTIRAISESGCELLSAVQSSGPMFPQKTQVYINLFDRKSGQSVNVEGRLTQAKRVDGQWVYRIRWKAIPDFFLKHGM